MSWDESPIELGSTFLARDCYLGNSSQPPDFQKALRRIYAAGGAGGVQWGGSSDRLPDVGTETAEKDISLP